MITTFSYLLTIISNLRKESTLSVIATSSYQASKHCMFRTILAIKLSRFEAQSLRKFSSFTNHRLESAVLSIYSYLVLLPLVAHLIFNLSAPTFTFCPHMGDLSRKLLDLNVYCDSCSPQTSSRTHIYY